jgi:heterodisulfide reductase subunit C
MAIEPGKTRDNQDIRETVMEAVGEELLACYQCYKCSAGCPVAFAMDMLPHQVIRAVVMNEEDRPLSSRTIWTCASCETCTTRCPNEIDIAKVMDVLRQISIQGGHAASVPNAPVFHQSFLESVRKRGRVHELYMLQDYSLKSGDLRKKLKTGEWKSDVKLGLKMLLRGKLKVLPPKCAGVKEVQSIFARAEEHKTR